MVRPSLQHPNLSAGRSSAADKPRPAEYIFRGYRQELSVRLYQFDVVATDRSRHEVAIGADLNLMRHYGISLQEMPLLCRRLLEARTEWAGRIDFAEPLMADHARERDSVAAARELKRSRMPKPTAPARPGAGFNGSTRGGHAV